MTLCSEGWDRRGGEGKGVGGGGGGEGEGDGRRRRPEGIAVIQMLS